MSIEDSYGKLAAENKQLTERLAAAEREMGSERTNLVAWIFRNMDDIACFWDDCNHDTRSECVVLIVKQYEAAKAGGVEP